jgi:hypothetical protein
LTATTGAAIIAAAFAAHASGREGLFQQCAGFQCPADGVHQRGWAAVGVRVVGFILYANQRHWQWRRAKGSGCGVGNVATN